MANNHPNAYPQLTSSIKSQKNDFTLKEYVSKYFYLLPWLLVSIGISLSIAYTRLRYINPVYAATGRVLIKSEKPGGNVFGEKFGDVVTASVNTRLMDDQIELIRSTALSRLVVRKADLQQSYFYKGKLRNRLIHNPTSPIQLHIFSVTDSSNEFSIEVKALDEQSFNLIGNPTRFLFGVEFQTVLGRFRIDKKIKKFGDNKEFICSWMPEIKLARNLAAGIQVGVATKGGNVLNFVYNSENPRVSEDVVNGFLNAYQEYSLKDKREGALSALEFIENQLQQSKTDLSNLESELQKFREENKIVALPEQASGYFGDIRTVSDKISEQAINIKMVDFMISYLNDHKNDGKSIPLLSGVFEGDAGDLISSYNKLQLQREMALQTVPAGSPIIKDFDLSLTKIKGDIILSLSKLKEGNDAVLENLKKAEMLANAELRNMPRKERQLLDITRQQKVMEELYASLLQKKLQTSISTASTLSNIQMLESGYSSGIPVSPNKSSFYTTAFLIGLIIPLALIVVFEYLNDKIRTRQDFLNGTSAPLLGEIGHVEGKQTLVISATDRKFVSEQFRTIRSSLQYILSNARRSNTILVTSCMSGEGKSFIATNIAAVLAISGKKTILVEFDIRKPRLLKGLGITLDNKNGLSHYLIGKSDINEIIHQVDGVENLYVMPCGVVPPNPAELILGPRLKLLFDHLEKDFEMVIVDTPPVGMVSDGFVFGNHADATIFVLRHNYTFKKQLEFIQSVYLEKKLPHMSILVNDVKAPNGYRSYGGYIQNGYGSYGYNNNADKYFQLDKPRRFSWMSRLFGK
jgi:capsular exopolysaccharide synthesis family protein